MHILVVKKSSVIALCNGILFEFDNDMNIVKSGDKLFSFFFGKFNILAKLFRKVIYSIKKISDENYIISSGNGLHRLNISDLSLKKIKTPDNFKKCLNIGVVNIDGCLNILYSNYNANLNKDEISVYLAPINSLDDYKLVYRFDKNKINHIHSFFQDPATKDIFFNVGDQCKHVGIWKLCSKTFEAKPYLTGLQDYRAVFCWIDNSKYFFATDFPGGNNYLKCINILDAHPNVKIVDSINGPVIYGTETDEFVYFATSAEPKKNLGLSAYIPILPIFQKSYLYEFDKKSSKVRCIASAKKDWLNPYLFGFGSFQFPCIEDNAKLHVNRIGIKQINASEKFSSFSSYNVYEL